MQSLNLLRSQLPASAPSRLINVLEDIVQHVQIHANFCIHHPNYKPFDLPEEVALRFLQAPSDLRDKFLSLQVRSFIYGLYYNGSLQTLLAPDNNVNSRVLQQNLENNTLQGIDLEFYQRLHQSNAGQGYFDPGWQVLRQEEDGTLAVFKHDLTLHVERDRHLHPSEQTAKPGEQVAMLLPKNLVQNGFYMAIGNAGPESNNTAQVKIVRIYFNLSPDGAVAMMTGLTQQLNQAQIPFSFKALYNSSEYKRHDSAVLYFDRSHYEAVRQVLQPLYQAHCTYFHEATPLFTKTLAPGLALAEEPAQKLTAQESFGMNRCQLIANGLLLARLSGDESPEKRMTAILEQFALLGIALELPYLNPHSEDIYTPLDLC
ncbi:hypothetical protein IQ268_18890 [Oculatella sp. LEGE 06141]|uniref:T3SS effector HopA1 family protein n=1 Tax=Oculatella sp. LEGE 06141 TaxID=1828648 RepID=UPI00187E514E|nr:T3SS effector HopA1 family protein [Oculatella sp. LEGE 06141]MBE9180630.1 hypothetical protein [Oculatella sp. LEGE 06141]